MMIFSVIFGRLAKLPSERRRALRADVYLPACSIGVCAPRRGPDRGQDNGV